MAERTGRLIFPDFFGTKAGLTDSSSIVNTTSPLEPGETLFEKDTGQFKTNLSSSTLPYSQSGYTGNAIRFSNLTELRGYDYPFDYQLVHTISPKTFFYYDPVDTSSPDDGTTVIVSNNGKRFKAFSPLATIPESYYVSGSLIVSESVTTTETIEKNNIKYWGAVGDGVTDDAVAIQNCVDYVSSSGGGIVYVPSTPNYYKTLAPIVLKYKTIVEGDGESSWIYNQASGEVVDGGTFWTRPFTMGTMNQTFYIRASRSAYLPVTASDDFIDLDPQPHSAPASWYNVDDIILIRNGEGEITPGVFPGSTFAELRRIISKQGNRLYVDVPFFENISPISSSTTASSAPYTGSFPDPFNAYVEGPGYSFITKMTPGFVGRRTYSSSLYIADQIGLRNLKISSDNGPFMYDGAAYKPIFENLYFENCVQGMIVNGYAFGTLRNIKGRKFAGRCLESAEGCHDNVFENLDLVRGGRTESAVFTTAKSLTDPLLVLSVRDKIVNSKIYSLTNSASINVTSSDNPNWDLPPVASFVVMYPFSTIENCEIGGVTNGGAMVTLRGDNAKVVNNNFICTNDSTFLDSEGNPLQLSAAILGLRTKNVKNATITGNIFNLGKSPIPARYVNIIPSDTTPHENINIQNNIFYIENPSGGNKGIRFEASASIFANNLIFSEDVYPMTLYNDTLNYNPSIYNNVYYNTSLGKMVVQNDSLQVFNSDKILEKSNIKYWGAVGDGVTDDTVAIQNCLNYNTASLDIRYDEISDLIGGNRVYGESGKTYLISDTLIVPPNVTFDLNNSKLYITSSHDAVRLKPSSRLENGLIIISSSLDYTDKSAVILLAESSSDNTKADDFFQSIRRPYENTAGISNISFRGPAITEGVTGSLESNCTGDALTLRCISTTGQPSLNIVGTKFENFDIIGFKTGINLEASGSDITPSVVAVNSNQFSNFTIKHTAVGIRLWTNKTPSTEISSSAGEPSSNRAGAVVNQNLFTNWWIQPVASTRSTYAAIINYGEKNTFDNFTIWDYAYSYPGTEAQGGSPFLDSTPLIYTPNGTLLNSNTDGVAVPSPAAIIDLNPNGGNVYNGGFNLYNVLDKSYIGANQYNSTNFSDFRMLSITNHNTSLPSYHKYGLPIGDQNDYLAFAWERGFGISQSRYPDSFTGSRYDNVSQSISTVFEPYGNGFVTYNSITTPVELTISFNQQEFNSYIREFSKLSLTDYYFRSDNRFFKGVGIQFKKQDSFDLNTYYQTPEHVKISVIQRNRTGGFSSENTIYEYNKNKNLYIGGVGKEAFEASSNGGFWDVKVLFSSSAEQDNPVALERISAWLGTDDNKAYIKRSDDYYYGGLEFKPVYGRNSDGTIDTTTPIRSASLHVSGSISMDNFILTSPNGSKYRFTVTDDGYLSITGSAL